MSIRKAAIVALLLLPLATSHSSSSTIASKDVALNPEETLFAFTRCIEDYAKTPNHTTTARSLRIRRWLEWDFMAAKDPATECFVSCLLVRLQLLDEESFMVANLLAQLEQYSASYGTEYNSSDIEKLARELSGYQSVNNCSLAYDAFERSFLPRLLTFRQIYFIDGIDRRKGKFEQLKLDGQSYFQYCEEKFYSENDEVWCAARNYTIPDDADFPKHMDCIFRGLRYLNRAGELNASEIVRDFHQVGITDMDDAVSRHLSSCQVNLSELALSYYKCLLNSTFVQLFKQALDYRELRSSDYLYGLRETVPSYNKSETEKMIAKIHASHCFSSE